MLGVWFIAREFYWRSGRGHRFAFCVSGHFVKDAEIESAIRGFESLYKTLSNHLCIKYAPAYLVDDFNKRDRFARKYKLDSIYHVVADTPTDKNARGLVYRIAHQSAMKDSVSRDFTEQCTRAIHLIGLGARSDRPGLNELLESQGRTIFQVLLSSISFVDFANEKFGRACTLLRALDDELAHLSADHPPRHNFRELECFARCLPSRWPGDSPPGPDTIQEALHFGEEGARHLSAQFPKIHLVLTRTSFYARDLDKSADHAVKFLKSGPTGHDLGYAHLNLAVIELCRGN